MVKSKINVVHLVLSLETGGMERFVYEHCIGIDKKKFNVSVCCIDRLGGFYQNLVDNGFKVDLLQKNQKHFDYFFPFRLRKYLISNEIDVLHIHSGAFFLGSFAGFMAKTKGIIYTEHGRHLVEPKIIFLLDKISCLFTDRIVVVSPDLKKHLTEKIKLPEKKIITIINGVDTNCFSPREKSKNLLAQFGLKKSSKIIGTVGRLADIKDHATLIKAFKIVLDNIPESKLIIVGDGPCENYLKDLSVELGIYGSVIFTGNQKDIQQILNLFDVFVLPSLREGTSLSLLEAMASGVAPIVTNVGGNPNVVKNGYNGYLVKPGDFGGMALMITDFFKDFAKIDYIKNNARKSVQDKFSLDKNIELYIKIYLELFESKQ
jgi:glycosyltransferase involved in cell wall biosynthesis